MLFRSKQRLKSRNPLRNSTIQSKRTPSLQSISSSLSSLLRHRYTTPSSSLQPRSLCTTSSSPSRLKHKNILPNTHPAPCIQSPPAQSSPQRQATPKTSFAAHAHTRHKPRHAVKLRNAMKSEAELSGSRLEGRDYATIRRLQMNNGTEPQSIARQAGLATNKGEGNYASFQIGRAHV